MIDPAVILSCCDGNNLLSLNTRRNDGHSNVVIQRKLVLYFGLESSRAQFCFNRNYVQMCVGSVFRGVGCTRFRHLTLPFVIQEDQIKTSVSFSIQYYLITVGLGGWSFEFCYRLVSLSSVTIMIQWLLVYGSPCSSVSVQAVQARRVLQHANMNGSKWSLVLPEEQK